MTRLARRLNWLYFFLHSAPRSRASPKTDITSDPGASRVDATLPRGMAVRGSVLGRSVGPSGNEGLPGGYRGVTEGLPRSPVILKKEKSREPRTSHRRTRTEHASTVTQLG